MVHQQLYVVLVAVELSQLRFVVFADLAHDLLAPRQQGVGEHTPPVFGDENQMNVQVGDNIETSSDIGVRDPAR